MEVACNPTYWGTLANSHVVYCIRTTRGPLRDWVISKRGPRVHVAVFPINKHFSLLYTFKTKMFIFIYTNNLFYQK